MSLLYTQYRYTTHTRFNSWMHDVNLHITPILASIKSHNTPYWPSRLYCSWHLKGPLNYWSERSWLVRSLTWYVCPAHHQAANNPTHQVCKRSWPRRDQNWWSQRQFIFWIVVLHTQTHTALNVHSPTVLCVQIRNHIIGWLTKQLAQWNLSQSD